MWAVMGEDVRQDFTKTYFDSRVALMMSYTNAGVCEVSEVVEAMAAALIQRFPRARYLPMDLPTRLRILVATHLPEWVYDTCYTSATRQ
nr:D-beta-hydroxybutyrate dehydrogenase, mitochondrial-like [Procambarus clarkii]